MSELLGKFGYVVILYQTSQINTGHFVCLRENSKKQLSYSDSYGYKYDTEQALGASFDLRFPKYLTNLIEKDGRVCTWNTFDYQRKSANVSTCGRYACVFCMWRELDFNTIKGIFENNSDAWLNIADNLIVVLTLLPLHDIRNFFQNINKFPVKTYQI